MFCGNCGNQVPDGANVCPNCGTALGVQTDNSASVNNSTPVNNGMPVNNGPVYQTPGQMPVAPVPAPDGGSNVNATISAICGVISIIVAVFGGIMFGVFGGLLAVILGVVALVTGISARKETNNAKGSAGLVCGILGLIFGVIFAASCGICGAVSGGYTCYGCVGGSCKAKNDLKSTFGDSFDLDDFEDLFDYYY